jgi:hypothetical protein
VEYRWTFQLFSPLCPKATFFFEATVNMTTKQQEHYVDHTARLISKIPSVAREESRVVFYSFPFSPLRAPAYIIFSFLLNA